ncbi:MAG: long-chain fatty acid--CoA ligase [Actinomycetia bacterium]|nr:long-chain fatty acid--CoA ligase [Actinomycetes bacterium]
MSVESTVVQVDGTLREPRADLEHGTIPRMVQASAARFDATEAIVDGDERITYAELGRLALEATRATIALGIEPGDRVAIWAPNSARWILAALGILGAGAQLVTVNTRFKAAEAVDILRRTNARAIFTVNGFLGTDYLELLRAEAPDLPCLDRDILLSGPPSGPSFSWESFVALAEAIDPTEADARIKASGPDDVSDILFTSGTTARPKGVLLTHGQSLRGYQAFNVDFGLRHGDRYLIVSPFFHCMGYKSGWMLSFMTGATCVPVPVLDQDDLPALVERERISVFPGPPTLVSTLLDAPDRDRYDLSSLRVTMVGASSVPAELFRRLRTELPFENVLTGYGLTECHALVSTTGPQESPEVIATTVGRPLPGLEVMIVGPDDEPLPTGEAGEILVRGYTVMRGYLDDPEATAEAITPDGWLHTGDVGLLDERGFIHLTDRKKDIFIVGGFNVSPAEVEATLVEHEAVAQVSVVGGPDARMGEVAVAFVVLRPGVELSESDLIAWARPRLANYKVPRHVHFVDSLPVNASLKVLRSELRLRAAELA